MRDDFKILAAIVAVVLVPTLVVAWIISSYEPQAQIQPVVVTLPSAETHIVEVPTQYLICDESKNLLLTVTITDEIVSMDPPKEAKSC